jgi:hypothetical protein
MGAIFICSKVDKIQMKTLTKLTTTLQTELLK